MNNQMFCNSEFRVKKCLLKTNLCCMICYKHDECSKQAGKIRPCKPSDFDEEDPCPFLI